MQIIYKQGNKHNLFQFRVPTNQIKKFSSKNTLHYPICMCVCTCVTMFSILQVWFSKEFVCFLKMCFFLVIDSGKEFHICIDLYSTVRFRKLVFGLGSENRPSVVCRVAYVYNSKLWFNRLYLYNGVFYCKTFHIDDGIAAFILSLTFNHCRQERMRLRLVLYEYWRARHDALFCTNWSLLISFLWHLTILFGSNQAVKEQQCLVSL